MADSYTVKESNTHHEHMVRPQHTNAHGTLFGGELMAWVDIVAATCAMRHARKAVVTASIDALHFINPVYLGWIVCLDASVNYVSNTSCEIGVKVTTLHTGSNEIHHTASAYLTFVALNEAGKPLKMSPVIPESADEKRRHAAAIIRRKHRLELKNKLYSKNLDD